MSRRPPESTRTDPLFPYTALFRSAMPPTRPAHDPDRAAAEAKWIALQRAGGHQRGAVTVVHPFRHIATQVENTQRIGFEAGHRRSEEHTSELQSLMRISYAVFGLKKKNNNKRHQYSSIIDIN